MKVNIRGENKQLRVTTVVIEQSMENEQEMKLSMFFCYNCQNPILQYGGNIASLIPGYVKTDYPILTMCKNCKKLYSFTGVAYI